MQRESSWTLLPRCVFVGFLVGIVWFQQAHQLSAFILSSSGSALDNPFFKPHLSLRIVLLLSAAFPCGLRVAELRTDELAVADVFMLVRAASGPLMIPLLLARARASHTVSITLAAHRPCVRLSLALPSSPPSYFKIAFATHFRKQLRQAGNKLEDVFPVQGCIYVV
eukprot:6198495-Pleurochrysis_carterae.AAC.1